MQSEKPYIPPFVRRLMKDATEEELFLATERLRRYLKAMYEIFLQQEEEKAAADSEKSDDHDRFQLGAS